MHNFQHINNGNVQNIVIYFKNKYSSSGNIFIENQMGKFLTFVWKND